MNNIPSLGPNTIPDIELLIFSCNGVKKQQQSLKDDKAPGPDNHYPWLLTLAANESGIFLIVESINQSIIYLPTLTPKSTSARSKYARALKLQL